MLKARKKNRVVRIPDDKLKEYKALGYTITDEDGKTVFEPEDKDAVIAALQQQVDNLKQQIVEKDNLLKQNATETCGAKSETKPTKGKGAAAKDK